MSSALLAAPRLCISSTSGGGGKTLFSLGLARAWTEAGVEVKPYKKGPDYIDAAWLAAACGRQCTNLDPFFLGPEELKHLFQSSMEPGCVALLEGNRGLYDGMNETGECSTAQVARTTDCPIVLTLDCVKATRTVAAVIRGLTSFEPGLTFAGVVLNRVGSPRHECSLRRVLEANVDVPVLGAIPRMTVNLLPERHMGLASRGGALADNLQCTLGELAGTVRENCDVDALLVSARCAPPLFAPLGRKPDIPAPHTSPRPVIGYVQDEALWFYYPENLQALRDAGCELRRLSFFSRPEDWQGLHGLYLGGGFPEDMAEEISGAPQLRILRQNVQDGLPVYAECGGLIVLCRSLKYDGRTWPMAGVVPADVHWHERPVGLGYVAGEICRENAFYPLGMTIKGHEFHYCACTFVGGNPDPVLRLSRGCGLTGDDGGFDGYASSNLWASFTHIFAPALPTWAKSFGKLARKRMNNAQE